MKKFAIVLLILSGAFSCNTKNETIPMNQVKESIDLSIVTDTYLDAPPNADIQAYQMAQFRTRYAQYEFDKVYDEVMKDEHMIKFMEFNSSSVARQSGALNLTNDLGLSASMITYFDKMTSLISNDQEEEIDVSLVQQGLENIKAEIDGDLNLSEADKEALLVSADMYIQNLVGIITIVENDFSESSGRVAGWFKKFINIVVSVVASVVRGAAIAFSAVFVSSFNIYAGGMQQLLVEQLVAC